MEGKNRGRRPIASFDRQKNENMQKYLGTGKKLEEKNESADRSQSLGFQGKEMETNMRGAGGEKRTILDKKREGFLKIERCEN